MPDCFFPLLTSFRSVQDLLTKRAVQIKNSGNKSNSVVPHAYDANVEQNHRKIFLMVVNRWNVEKNVKHANQMIRTGPHPILNTFLSGNSEDYTINVMEHVGDEIRELNPSAQPHHFRRGSPNHQYPSALKSRTNPDHIPTISTLHCLHQYREVSSTNNAEFDRWRKLQFDVMQMTQQKRKEQPQLDVTYDNFDRLELLNTLFAVDLDKMRLNMENLTTSLIQVKHIPANSGMIQNLNGKSLSPVQSEDGPSDKPKISSEAQTDVSAPTVKEWSKRSKQWKADSLLFEATTDEDSLERLLSQLEVERRFLESEDYRIEWRKRTVTNMELCLKILFLCERGISIEKKKLKSKAGKHIKALTKTHQSNISK